MQRLVRVEIQAPNHNARNLPRVANVCQRICVEDNEISDPSAADAAEVSRATKESCGVDRCGLKCLQWGQSSSDEKLQLLMQSWCRERSIGSGEHIRILLHQLGNDMVDLFEQPLPPFAVLVRKIRPICQCRAQRLRDQCRALPRAVSSKARDQA